MNVAHEAVHSLRVRRQRCVVALNGRSSHICRWPVNLTAKPRVGRAGASIRWYMRAAEVVKVVLMNREAGGVCAVCAGE